MTKCVFLEYGRKLDGDVFSVYSDLCTNNLCNKTYVNPEWCTAKYCYWYEEKLKGKKQDEGQII